MYDRFVPIPGGFFSGQVFFPEGGVLARTFSLEMVAGNPHSRRRLETQILHFDGTNWNAYTYAWNEAQTDAELVPAAGMDRAITVSDANAPGSRRQQTWHYPARAQCITCHNPWAGYALAFNPLQLNRVVGADGRADDQLRTLRDLGLVEFLQADGNKRVDELPPGRLANPHDAKAPLGERARSYLHVNCSHCHQFNAGGTALIDLRSTVPLGETKTLRVPPVQGAFHLDPAFIIAPGDPSSSVLYYRMAKLGPGRMPHIGSDFVDERGLRLVYDWIQQLPHDRQDPALSERNHAFEELFGVLRSTDKAQAAKRTEVANRLLSSTRSALLLARALEEKRLPDAARAELLSAARGLDNAEVRDLFERFLPDDQRVKRLGTAILPESILALKGDVAAGRELFFKSAGLQCLTCHRVQGTGGMVGPDLSEIGKKYSRAQILESILQPSKFIDPKYATYLVETHDGTVATGLLASRNEREVVLRTAQDKELRLATTAVAALQPQPTSLMPEMLLRDLTAEQAASLVDFLASLKDAGSR